MFFFFHIYMHMNNKHKKKTMRWSSSSRSYTYITLMTLVWSLFQGMEKFNDWWSEFTLKFISKITLVVSFYLDWKSLLRFFVIDNENLMNIEREAKCLNWMIMWLINNYYNCYGIWRLTPMISLRAWSIKI